MTSIALAFAAIWISPWFAVSYVVFIPFLYSGFLALLPYSYSGRRYHIPLLEKYINKGIQTIPITETPKDVVVFSPNAGFSRAIGTVGAADLSSIQEFFAFTQWDAIHVNKRDVERATANLHDALVDVCAELLHRDDRWMWVRQGPVDHPVEVGVLGGSWASRSALDALCQLVLTLQFYIEHADSRPSAGYTQSGDAQLLDKIRDLRSGLELSRLRSLRNYVAHVDRPPIIVRGFLRRADTRLGQPLAELELSVDPRRLLILDAMKRRRRSVADQLVYDWIVGEDPQVPTDFWPILCETLEAVDTCATFRDSLRQRYVAEKLELVERLLHQHPDFGHSLFILKQVTSNPDRGQGPWPPDTYESIDLYQLLEHGRDLARPLEGSELLTKLTGPLIRKTGSIKASNAEARA